MKRGDELMRRILRWVIAAMRFVDSVPRTTATISITKQLADSVGSVGANFVEARAARSKKEFASSVGISAKECREGLFWLTVLRELALVSAERIESLLREGEELAKILTTIAKNAKLVRDPQHSSLTIPH